MTAVTAPDPEEILPSHEERQAAVEAYRAEGRSDAWVFGWWRNQMRHTGD
jgi:hypothetical protein